MFLLFRREVTEEERNICTVKDIVYHALDINTNIMNNNLCIHSGMATQRYI